jgi:Abortive infection alpha
MSDPGSLIPITDEQAKAVQEALKTLQGIGGFLKQTFGTVPEDLVGLLGGDWLKARRLENFAHIAQKAQEQLKARHVDAPEPPRLSILLPLIVAAADEEDDELQDIWARLLAAAADPARAGLVRLAFVGIVKNMDPSDTLVFRELSMPAVQPANIVAHITSKFGMTPDDVIVSCLNLEELGCVAGAPGNPRITPMGRLLIRAVSD